MFPKQKLLRELRRLGYSFKRQGKNMDVWKKRGSTKRIMVSRRKEHDPLYAERTLRHAGMDERELADLFNGEADGGRCE